MTYFAETFGFSPKEVVALTGAHTLGKAHRRNLGFGTAPWVKHPNSLDNAFYQDMMNEQFKWHQTSNTVGPWWDRMMVHWWSHGTKDRFGLMLNTDMLQE